ncbi:MAG TPA: hypothetical protein VMJ10_17525 [Kofleriaceae bacterium]|nr:hypothetical protein [Kofleriaceae bacterium]
MRALIVAAVWALGCYRPHVVGGQPCSSDSECPVELKCVGNVCGGTLDGQPDAPVLADGSFVLPDADSTCTCNGNNLSCSGAMTTCPLGCVPQVGGARCALLAPSNGVDPMLATAVSDPITISGAATLDTDTGAITGSLTRTAGSGVIAGIGFAQETVGAPMGVFVFSSLAVTATGSLQLTGSRSAVFLVRHSATIAGTIDGSGGKCGTGQACAGPGGGAGATIAATPGGCGPGGTGAMDTASNADSGGGGGGGGASGGGGGDGGAIAAGGGGAGCIAATLVPLVGGSGGGGGGPGAAAARSGGGGGGALQITALDQIDITGTITMAGAGGQGGGSQAVSPFNGGAGCGGGAGGGILLEAIAVTIEAGAVVAANGGGGGGAADGPKDGADGANGAASGTPAAGGLAGNGGPGTAGGAGGAGTATALTAQDAPATDNGGGGGGAAGRIYLRAAAAPTVAGTASPSAGTGTVSGE